MDNRIKNLGSETERVEYKLKLNDKLERVVVSFLNTEGGYIYFGVNNNGDIIGLDDVDDTAQRISNRLNDGISPNILGYYSLKIIEEGSLKYIKLTIAEGNEKPYYIDKYGMSPKGCYIKLGTQTLPMTKKTIEHTFNKRVRNDLKAVPAPNQSLTFNQLKIYYEENGFEIGTEFLKSLGFYNEDGKFNYLAYLFADVNSVSIKVAKYDGLNKVDLITNEEFGYCCLIKACHRVLDRLKIENATSAEITYKERIEIKLVEPQPLHEAVINAIIHQDFLNAAVPVFEIYDNRIEVTSSGGLPTGLKLEDFFKGRSVPRNPDIMRIFKDVNLVEQLGSGMQRILAKYDKSIFEVSDNFVVVSFPFNKKAMERMKMTRNKLVHNVKLNKNEIKELIYNAILENNKITRKELAELCGGISVRTIQRYIKEIDNIEYVGRGNNGYWLIKN